MVFYHQIYRGFRLKFPHHPILWSIQHSSTAPVYGPQYLISAPFFAHPHMFCGGRFKRRTGSSFHSKNGLLTCPQSLKCPVPQGFPGKQLATTELLDVFGGHIATTKTKSKASLKQWSFLPSLFLGLSIYSTTIKPASKTTQIHRQSSSDSPNLDLFGISSASEVLRCEQFKGTFRGENALRGWYMIYTNINIGDLGVKLIFFIIEKSFTKNIYTNTYLVCWAPLSPPWILS